METQDLYYKSKEFAIDHVQSIVEDSISIFIPTNIGCLNGIVEIIVNEIPLNIRFGVLIYNSSDANVQIIQNEILVNIKDYVEYICDFEMPLILIVVSSELDRNYWIDVKKILKQKKNDSVSIKKEISYEFNFETFNNVIIEYLNREKSSYLITHEFIQRESNLFLLNFINSHFKIIDYSIPFILNSSSLVEFMQLIGIQIRIEYNWLNGLNAFGQYMTYCRPYDFARNIWFMRIEENETFYFFSEAAIEYLDILFTELQKEIG